MINQESKNFYAGVELTNDILYCICNEVSAHEVVNFIYNGRKNKDPETFSKICKFIKELADGIDQE